MRYVIVILSLMLNACGVTGIYNHYIVEISDNNADEGSILVTMDGTEFDAGLSSDSLSQLDEEDRMLAIQTIVHSLESIDNGKVTSWMNTETGNAGTIRPTKTTYKEDGTSCREYTHTIYIGSQTEKLYSIACRQKDGLWRNQ